MIKNNISIKEFIADVIREAGEKVKTILNRGNIDVTIKAHLGDLKTRADETSGKFIISQIKKYFPNHTILNEEGGNQITHSEYKWVIDPVDGTLPMVLGMDYFGISIGLFERGKPVHGAIYFPKLDLCVETEKDAGTSINDKKIIFADQNMQEIKFRSIVTAFDFSATGDRLEAINTYLAPFIPFAKYIFLFGAFTYAALLLLQEKIDIFIHPGATIYDVGAALLAIKEAGGEYRILGTDQEIDFSGQSIPVVLARSKKWVDHYIAKVYGE